MLAMNRRLREMILAGGALTATACIESTLAPTDSIPCCNGNPDPCCTCTGVVADFDAESECGQATACRAAGGTWNTGTGFDAHPHCEVEAGDADADVAACADANILASNYDRSCAVDTDCVAIAEGNVCDPCVFDGMLNAAINAGAMAKYSSDIAGTPGAAGIGGAGCSTGGGTVSGNSNWGPFCCSGRCHVGSPCPNTAAAMDASADVAADVATDAGRDAADASAE
jgi:hypothetical protein